MNSDLNLRTFYAGESQKDNQLIQLITTCIEENYHNVAIVNYVKDQNIQKQHASTFKPYSQEFLLNKFQQSSNLSPFSGQIKQYSRLTLEAGDVKFLSSIKQENQFLSGYDLIAIKPKTEAVFTHMCTTLTFFDIITFDCFEKLPFIPKAKICQLLLEKNIMFELNYGDAVQDPNKRRQFISNAQIIVNSTKGKNILMSSDTNHWLYHRSPYDLVALGMMIGLKKDQATKAVGENADLAIKHSREHSKEQFVKLQKRIQLILKKRNKKLQQNKWKRLIKKYSNPNKLSQPPEFCSIIQQKYIKMLNLFKPKFQYYQRLKQHMEINQTIRKENLDIQRTFFKLQKPLIEKAKQKVLDNKNRIYLFLGIVLMCKIQFAYETYLARIPYRRLLFNKIKSHFLGLESVYPKPLVEQIYNNKLPQEFMNKFIMLDQQLPLGVTKKFIVRCLSECQITLTKEQKEQFYQKHGFLYGIYSKNSGINFKELNNFFEGLQINYNKLMDVFDTMRDQEIQYQKRAIEKMNQKPFQYSSNLDDSITRRIQPYFDKL